MVDKENCLLEIINTGPCTFRELQLSAPSLMSESGNDETQPGEVLDLLDRMTSMGLIGFTGVSLEYAVPSQKGLGLLEAGA